jgi:hypothetical protein
MFSKVAVDIKKVWEDARLAPKMKDFKHLKELCMRKQTDEREITTLKQITSQLKVDMQQLSVNSSLEVRLDTLVSRLDTTEVAQKVSYRFN